jgi:hypothetical protein
MQLWKRRWLLLLPFFIVILAPSSTGQGFTHRSLIGEQTAIHSTITTLPGIRVWSHQQDGGSNNANSAISSFEYSCPYVKQYLVNSIDSKPTGQFTRQHVPIESPNFEATREVYSNLTLNDACVVLIDTEAVRRRARISLVIDFVLRLGDLPISIDLVIRSEPDVGNRADDVSSDNSSALLEVVISQLPISATNAPEFRTSLVPFINTSIHQQIARRIDLVQQKQLAVHESIRLHRRLHLIVGELITDSHKEDEAVIKVNELRWLRFPLQVLDLTDEQDFEGLFDVHGNVVDTFVAEHVWEHMSLAEAFVAAQNCFKYLKPRGLLRIAVPDVEWMSLSNEKNATIIRSRWQQRVGTNDGTTTFRDGSFACEDGIGEKWLTCLLQNGLLYKDIMSRHQLQFSSFGLQRMLESVGFDVNLVEWTDSFAISHHKAWTLTDGFIRRSQLAGGLSRSIIIDARKPGTA